MDLVDVLRRQERRTAGAAVAGRGRLSHCSTAGRLLRRAGGAAGPRSTWCTLGGQGTPMVAEFAPAIFAARLGRSPYAGTRLIADALDLRYRLPRLWARVEKLEVEASYAREVARRTRTLTCAQAAFVDEQVAEEADGRLPWSRFTDLIEAAVITADPKAAEKREAEAAQKHVAAPTRSNEYGMRGFFVHAPFPVIARLDATVAYLAQALLDFGDTTTLDERRVKAVLILANPTQAVHVLRAYATWRASQTPSAGDPRPTMQPGIASSTEPSSPTRPTVSRLLPPIRNSTASSGPTPLIGSGLSSQTADPTGSSGPARHVAKRSPAQTPNSTHRAPLPPIGSRPRSPIPSSTGSRSSTQPTSNPLRSAPLHRRQGPAPSCPAVRPPLTGTDRERLPPVSPGSKANHPSPPTGSNSHLGGCRITVTPVLDLANQIPVDAWEIPHTPPPRRPPDDAGRHLPVRHQHHPQANRSTTPSPTTATVHRANPASATTDP